MSSLGQWFRKWWHQPGPQRHDVVRPIALRPLARHQRHAFDDALEALRQSPDGGAGRLRVISLADFRAAVGEKWPRLADKVAMIVEQLIRRALGAGNLYQRQGQDCWLLLFPRISPDQARTIAVSIAQEISRHLLGERCVGGERPLAIAAHLDAAIALDDDGRVRPSALIQAVDQSRALFDHLSPCAPAAIRAGVALLDAATPQRRVSAPHWTPIVIDHDDEQPQEPWQNVKPLPADAHLSLLWRPTWVAEREAIAAYCARVTRLDHPGAPALEGSMAYPLNDPAAAFVIDRFVAAAAMRDLRKAGTGASAIIVPLTWSSLAGEGRAELVAPFADIAAAMRQQRVRVEVCRIPDTIGVDDIQAVVGALRPLCGQVLLRLRLSSPLLCQADALGGATVGLDLSELRSNERMNDDRLLSVLDSLQDSAGQAGLGCYVWSARRRRVVGGVVSHGFDMVNGPGLMKDVGRPAMIMPAPRERFRG